MPLSIASLPLLAFIPNYYVSDLGLDFAVVALVMLFARSFDAVTDPLIGFLLIERIRAGEEDIWMFFSMPLLMLATYKNFFPLKAHGNGFLLIWIFFPLIWEQVGIIYYFWFLVWFGWSMLFIPYYSWAAELSSDYNERSTIVGWRMFIGTFGNAIQNFTCHCFILICIWGC